MTLMKLLRQYHYDPLDRLTGETSAGRSTQRFYQEDDLVTEMGDQGQLTILHQGRNHWPNIGPFPVLMTRCCWQPIERIQYCKLLQERIASRWFIPLMGIELAKVV